MNKQSAIERKRIFLILLLILNIHTNLFSKTFLSDKDLEKISTSKEWKALLHIRDSKPKIENKSFLLSFNNFSLKNELKKTIENFDAGEKICKYPARYYLLKNKIKNNTFKIKECKDLNYYLEQTKPKDIDLVFAAENVTSPSSMMGHVFFKINSEKINNKIRKNAVSFYTVINTVNIPVLIYKSTIEGMKGFFILNPYSKQINKYLYEEDRSIWEYKLKLSEFQKKLILFHFWELKDINITYYFTGFNCATMIDDILSLTKDNYIQDNLWLTPKDVIKNANKNKIVEKINMIPSLEWKLNMLSENINRKKIDELIYLIKTKSYKNLKKYKFENKKEKKELEKQFIIAYSKYLFLKKNSLDYKEYLKIIDLFSNTDYLVNIEDYKNPLKTPDDSQSSIIFGQKANKKFMGINFLAASNSIYDDNREYFSENTLKIGEVNLRAFSNKLEINSIDIYNMKLLLPWNNITNPISKEFKVSYENHKDKKLQDVNALNISGGMGISNSLHDDITLYNMIKTGLGINLKKVYPYTSFENGLIIYELFNMKSVISNEFIYNQNNSEDLYMSTTINQSMFFDNKNYKLDINFNELKSDDYYEKTVMFNLTYFF